VALIYEGMECALCGKALDIHGPIFTSFAFDHPLSDAALHWACFYDMKDHEAFLDRMYQLEVKSMHKNRYWRVIVADAESLVATNDLKVTVIIKGSALRRELALSDWPSGLRALLAEDKSFLPDAVARKTNETLTSLHRRFESS
jgi:hypothetical protein